MIGGFDDRDMPYIDSVYFELVEGMRYKVRKK